MKEFWHKAPLVRIAVPLCAGIIFGIIIESEFFLRTLGFALFIITLGILVTGWNSWKQYKNIPRFGIILNLCYFFSGYCLVEQLQDQRAERFLPIEAPLLAYLVDFPDSSKKSYRLELQLISKEEDNWYKTEKKILLYAPLDSHIDTLLPGDIIRFDDLPNPFDPPVNPGEFDYNKYMKGQGFSGSVYSFSGVRVNRAVREEFKLKSFFRGLQLAGINRFKEAGLGERELGVGAALILGERNIIDRETRDSFSSAGVVHILAVSGLHVGIIYLVLIALLRRIIPGHRLRWWRFVITLIFLWLYAGITGFSPSVLRATAMFSFIVLGVELGKKTTTYNMLAASAVLLMVVNPLIITEVGFQLSYLAVIGIVSLFKPLYSLFVFKNYILDKIWSLIVVSFSAQLATFPLSIYYFDQFPNLFLVSNLLIIPLATLALYSGLAFLFLFWIPIIGNLLGLIVDYSLFSMNEIVDYLDSLPHSLSTGIQFGLLATIVMYLFIITGIASFRYPNRIKVMLPLVLLLILFGMRSYQEIKSVNLSQVWLLKGEKGILPIVLKGGEALVIDTKSTSSSLLDNQFFISGFLTESRSKEFKLMDIKVFQNNSDSLSVLYLSGIPLIFLEKATLSGFDIPDGSIVILGKGTSLKVIGPELSKAKEIVIDPNASPFYHERFIQNLDSLNLSYYDMKKRGALKLAG